MKVEDKLFVMQAETAEMSLKWGGVVLATYQFPAIDMTAARKMALQIASGQTLGYVPDPIDKYLDFIGRVIDVGMREPGVSYAEIAFPGHLVGADIAGMLTVLFGKISFVPGISLVAVNADDLFLKGLAGPRIGLNGLRKLAGVSASQPLLMAILKPGIGPSDDDLAQNFARLTKAGTHLVKDDEVRIDSSLAAAQSRLEKVLSAGGGRGIYVQNLTGPAFELRDRALRLQAAGAQAFLFSPLTYGLSVLQSLCCDPDIKVPIFAHPAFTGIMMCGPSRIAPSVLLGTLMRWLGCDAVLFPSPYGSIALPKVDAIAIHQALVRNEGSLKKVASVPSAGIMPEFVKAIFEDFGSDVVVNAGTGMARNAGGIEEGAGAFLREMNQHFSTH